MRLLFSAVAFCLALPFVSLTVQAEEVLVPSAVTKVMIFPSGAEIIRTAKINIVEGDQTIILQGLPVRLIESSLRVEGTGGKAFQIGAVDTKRILVDVPDEKGVLDKTERARLEKEIERLSDESSLLTSRIRAAETQRRLMERLTDLPGQSPVRPLDGQGAGGGAALFSVENWGKIFDLIGARMAVADDLILKYQQEQRQKIKDITRLKKRLAQQPPKKERQMEVRVAIASMNQMKASLIIKYQVREASWRPFYDARLSTGAKGRTSQLLLTRRAGIRQWTGEEWKNVKLSLSTTRPQQGAQAPVLHPKRLDLVVPRPAPKRVLRRYMDKVRGMAQSEMAMEDGVVAAPAPRIAGLKKMRVRAEERRANITQYAFQAVFEIPGQTTIMPTGDEKKVAISRDEIKPDLNIKTVPKLNSSAFLYAKFTHDKKATPLLPGKVALYRDGTFTGNGLIPLVNAGDEHALGFGVDDAVKVTRSEIKRTKGETGLLTTSKLDERRYNIKITNLHQTPVQVEVIDQIPFSVNEKVVVRLLPTSTRPSRQNIKDQRGILAWDFTLGEGKEKLINLDYTISWPADQRLSD